MNDDSNPDEPRRFGALAQLPWVKTRRASPPTRSAEAGGDVVYNVRSVKDLRAAVHRATLTKKK